MSAWDLLYWYAIEVVDVYDGDSVTNATLDLGFNHKHEKRSIRFDGIDTPELRGSGITDFEKTMAKAAQKYVLSHLPEGQRAMIHSQKPRRNRDDEEDKDGRGRILGWVYSNNDGLLDDWDIQANGLPDRAFSLNNHLVKAKIAAPYDGKKARPAKGNPEWWPAWYSEHERQWYPLLERYAA